MSDRHQSNRQPFSPRQLLPQAIEAITGRTPTAAPTLEPGHDDGDGAVIPEPLALFRALEASDRFRRDTRVGGIFHHGKISFREVSSTNSLHIILDGDRISAHVDEVSPLRFRADGSAHYAFARVVAHNLAAAFADLTRRARGLHGHQRCNLHCERVWVDGESIAELAGDEPGAPTTTTSDAATSGHTHHDGHDGHEGHCAPTSGAPTSGAPTSGAPTSGAQPEEVAFSLVDEAIHLLDTEAAPWSIQVEVRVSGHLDEARLRSALDQALAAHPMARARKAASRRTLHRDNWQIPARPDLDALRVVDCPDDTALAAARADLQSLGVPLAESPPLRARLARNPDGDVLMLNVNHAAMDGFGALRVLESLARAYTGRENPAPELNFLEGRDLPVRLATADAPTRIRRHLALAEKLRDLALPPARLAPDGATEQSGYGFHHLSLSAEQTTALDELDHPGTVNDVLLTALHLAIAGWNAEHGKRCGRVGVLVPSNLRPPQWQAEMVGNFSLPARVSTTAGTRRDPRAALDTITAQTRRKKRTGMGTALIEVLGRSHALPLWAKELMVLTLPLTGNRLVDTSMLSNLGALAEPPAFGPEAGDTVEVWFSPPARMPLGLAIGAVTASGRLHLCFRYRHRLFSADAAPRFAALYLRELDSVVASATCSPAMRRRIPYKVA